MKNNALLEKAQLMLDENGLWLVQDILKENLSNSLLQASITSLAQLADGLEERFTFWDVF